MEIKIKPSKDYRWWSLQLRKHSPNFAHNLDHSMLPAKSNHSDDLLTRGLLPYNLRHDRSNQFDLCNNNRYHTYYGHFYHQVIQVQPDNQCNCSHGVERMSCRIYRRVLVLRVLLLVFDSGHLSVCPDH